MSTAATKSSEDRDTVTEVIVELNETDEEDVNMSTVSNISYSTVKVDSDSCSVEVGRHKKELDELQEKEAAVSVNAVTSKTDGHVATDGTELSVQSNDNKSNDTQKLKQLTPEQSDSEADDLRKAYLTQLANETSISADSRHGSRLSVRSEVVGESVKMVRDGLVDVESDDSDDVSVSVTSQKSRETDCHEPSLASLRPAKSQKVTESGSVDVVTVSVASLGSKQRYKRTRRRKTEKSEANSNAMSLMSVKADKSLGVPDSSTVVTASEHCLRPCATHKVAKNCVSQSEAGSQVMSLGPGESQEAAEIGCAADSATKSSLRLCEFADGITKSASRDLSRRESVTSHLSVRPSANNKGSDEVESGTGTMGCRPSVTSLNSEMSSNASSVVVSKPPKHTSVTKARRDGNTPAAVETAESSCTSGNFIWFILHFL